MSLKFNILLKQPLEDLSVHNVCVFCWSITCKMTEFSMASRQKIITVSKASTIHLVNSYQDILGLMYDRSAISALKFISVLFPMCTSLGSSEVNLSNPSIHLHNFLLALLMLAKK